MNVCKLQFQLGCKQVHRLSVHEQQHYIARVPEV
jgi:hypothetical protein